VTDLASIAGDLYALDLDAFTAERNARAAAARADAAVADGRELATAIAALPKPSAAAWLVNQLVRAEPEVLSAALALGPALRAAQEALDRDALRELGRQRRDALGDVVDAARRIGADRGRPVSAALADDVEQTVLAAIADADAAIAVRSGRLVRALITIGGEPVDLSGAVAAPGEELGDTGAAALPRASRRPEPTGPGPAEKARAEKSAAEHAVTAARKELRVADTELAAAADRHEQLVGERDDALAEYERLEKEVGAAERQRREAIRERDRAHRRVEGTERVLARADERLAQLE
jgi:hypothetical protein